MQKGLRTATHEALIFRAARHAQAGETGAEQERALELNEGLAEYTGVKLSGAVDPHRDVAATLRAAEQADAFSRMFAYASGPAYGLLLEDAAPGWREGPDGGVRSGRPAGRGGGLHGAGGPGGGVRPDRGPVWRSGRGGRGAGGPSGAGRA